MSRIDDINNMVASILMEDKVQEQFIDQNSRNSEVNDFINDVKNDLYELQKLANNIDNMNSQQEEVMKIVQKIGERADIAFEKLKISSPEDVNQ